MSIIRTNKESRTSSEKKKRKPGKYRKSQRTLSKCREQEGSVSLRPYTNMWVWHWMHVWIYRAGIECEFIYGIVGLSFWPNMEMWLWQWIHKWKCGCGSEFIYEFMGIRLSRCGIESTYGNNWHKVCICKYGCGIDFIYRHVGVTEFMYVNVGLALSPYMEL